MNKNSLSLRNFEIDYLDDFLADTPLNVEDLLTGNFDRGDEPYLKSMGLELVECCEGDVAEPSERWSVLKIGEEYWKVEFNYYSFSGHEWEDSVAYRVTPKEKLVVVWE